MIQILFKLILCVLLAIAAAFAYLAVKSGDPLFEPKTNLEAGTWYLHRAMAHWDHQSDPTPFALAEYNAGASRVQRWGGGNGVAEIPEHQFLQKIDFPATRRYVESIIDRYRFYQRRGRM